MDYNIFFDKQRQHRTLSQENAIGCDEILQQFIVVDMDDFKRPSRDSSDFSSGSSIPSRATEVNQMK
jgi:hypothetical protein